MFGTVAAEPECSSPTICGQDLATFYLKLVLGFADVIPATCKSRKGFSQYAGKWSSTKLREEGRTGQPEIGTLPKANSGQAFFLDLRSNSLPDSRHAARELHFPRKTHRKPVHLQSEREATGTDAGIRGLAVPGLQLTLVQEVEPTPIRQALDICAARLPVSEHLKKRPWPGQTMAFEYELTSAEMAQLQHSPATCLHP